MAVKVNPKEREELRNKTRWRCKREIVQPVLTFYTFTASAKSVASTVTVVPFAEKLLNRSHGNSPMIPHSANFFIYTLGCAKEKRGKCFESEGRKEQRAAALEHPAIQTLVSAIVFRNSYWAYPSGIFSGVSIGQVPAIRTEIAYSLRITSNFKHILPSASTFTIAGQTLITIAENNPWPLMHRLYCLVGL
nr:hypothetical protein L204_04541 [Cryptococcus depauperatus CBS 7855]